MTREENLHWLNKEIETWENECQSKHPIKEALYAARKALEKELCEDAVSRVDVKKIAKEMYLEVANMELDAKTISDCISCTASKCREVLERKLQALPPVTPQEPNTWSLDDAREDFMHDVYNALDFLPTNEEANRIIDIFDRVTSSIEQAPRWIPVTEGLPEEDGRYLVTVENLTGYDLLDSNVFECEFCYTDWIFKGWKDNKVIAWMPLPQPYKAESEDKE